MKKPLVLSVDDPRTVPPFDDADMYAVKACAKGIANEGQQRRAIEFIINGLARTYDLEARFGEDGERMSTFAGGKRFVGLQIVRLINMAPPKPKEIV